MNYIPLRRPFLGSVLFLSTICQANSADTIKTFNETFTQHGQLVSEQKLEQALPLAKKSYTLAKALFEPLDDARLVATDNYALNLQATENYAFSRTVFIELLSLYEQKYGKHALELLPLLNDITSLNEKLSDEAIEGNVSEDEAKEYAIRKYKLHLRHYSDDFVKQFADPNLPTTIHSENTKEKIEGHFDKEYAIYESKHWSIIHPPEQLTFVKKKMAPLMEHTYRSNISFLVAMGLRNKPIEEKMTAVYFANRSEYKSYIKAITGDNYGASVSGGIYSPKARSIFFFGYGKDKGGKPKPPNAQTVAHEVSHQVLYSTGLQSIHYVQPRWLTEGLASSFEYHSRKDTFGPHTTNYSFNKLFSVKKRIKSNTLITLSDLIGFDGDDESLKSMQNQADVYNLGAILVRYLYTYYPDEFKDYLTILRKSRTTLYERAKFGKNTRLKQFSKAFGDPDHLQEEFSAFIDELLKDAKKSHIKYKEAKRKAKKKKKAKESNESK